MRKSKFYESQIAAILKEAEAGAAAWVIDPAPAAQTAGAGGAAPVGAADPTRAVLVDGLHERHSGRWPGVPDVQRDRRLRTRCTGDRD